MRAPNMRLKLAGVIVSTESLCCALARTGYRSTMVAPAAVDFTSAPDSRRYRTVLTGAAARGPNFAGHYTVGTWGCGSSCQSNVVLDAATGRIVASFNSSMGAAYRLDSRLLLVNPPDSA